MEIVKNTLEPSIETWTDPGVYPSGAGGGPLAPYRYVEYVEGEITVEITTADLLEALREEIWGPVDTDTRPKIQVKKWVASKLELVDGKIRMVLEVDEFESDDVVDDGPDYEPEPDYD